jgi:hypothetical protein
MIVRPAVLVDDMDNRLGSIAVGPTIFVIKYEGRYFYRTEKAVKLHHSHRNTAIVFEETEVATRSRLNPI